MKTSLPEPTGAPHSETPPRTDATTPLPLSSAALLGGRGEIVIAHEGETYRLRRTRQGKLILTK